MISPELLKKSAETIAKARYAIAYTGAGISVESGVPPFRGENGIWNSYDPKVLDIDFFFAHPKESWNVIRELFYKYFGNAKANNAHLALAQLEEAGLLKCVITQNIDNLHQQAGSNKVFEFHGNSLKLICTKCKEYYTTDGIDMDNLPPYCTCSGLLKPDFVFFGEGIPMEAYQNSVEAASKADVLIIIGSTGEVMPAAQIPYMAKQNGATIIEVNPVKSKFTNQITDIHLQGKAGEVMEAVYREVIKNGGTKDS